MASLVLSGDTSGSITLAAPAVAGSTTQTLVNVTGTLAPIVSGTAVASTSGTSVDFTGIPSWAKRITVMFSGVSTNGTSNPQIQIGDSGGIENTGYLGSSGFGTTFGLSTTGFSIGPSTSAASIFSGIATITLLDPATNTWAYAGNYGYSNAGGVAVAGGAKPLSATLDRLRITTVNGTDTFDAGTINILYE